MAEKTKYDWTTGADDLDLEIRTLQALLKTSIIITKDCIDDLEFDSIIAQQMKKYCSEVRIKSSEVCNMDRIRKLQGIQDRYILKMKNYHKTAVRGFSGLNKTSIEAEVDRWWREALPDLIPVGILVNDKGNSFGVGGARECEPKLK